MRVLVTGATGFVGRKLCSELTQHGHAPIAAVRDRSRAAGLCAQILVVGDLETQTPWAAILSDVDVVVHLAARVHVMQETARDPLAEFRAINVGPTEALAQAAATLGVRRLVYVSSIKVNGEATAKTPFSGGDAPRPADPYGISKWEAEQSLWRISASSGLEVAVVRPPLVYGPGVGGNFLRLLQFIRRGIPLPLGAVENLRSMIYNGNLANALGTCAFHPDAAGKTYLVSDGEDLSTADLMRKLAAGLGVKARLWPVPRSVLQLAGTLTGRAAEIDRLAGSLRVDSSPIRTELGWRPPYSVEEGLAETARWFAALQP